MKLVFDERIKHRLVGLAVIISLAAIFAPAIMKKSSQRFDNPGVSVKLPAKPKMPDMEMADEKAMFETVKVAHVDIPATNEEFEPATTIANAEPLTGVNDVKATKTVQEPSQSKEQRLVELNKDQANPPPLGQVTQAKKTLVVASRIKPKQLGKQTKPIVAAKAVKVAKKLAHANVKAIPGYAVQVALFTRQNNAISLVNRLKSKGFQASYSPIKTANGTSYKVLVGQTKQKEQAQKTKLKLATAMQIKGFVVPTTGIS